MNSHSPTIVPPPELRSVAVLGAGVCGLAAAWQLLQSRPGLEVTLIESESRPGGLARSLSFDGLKTDLGPHRIHTELGEAMEFIRDLAGPELIEVRRSSRMWLGERWVDYPPRPAEMLRMLGPLRLAGFALSFLKHRMTGGRVGREGTSPGKANAADRDSFAAIMQQAFGPALYDFLVRPYAEKVWKTSCEALHGDVARVRVSAGGLDRLIRQAFGRGGMGSAGGGAGGGGGQPAAALKSYHYLRGGIGRLAEKMTEEIARRGGTVRCGRTIIGLDNNSTPGGGAFSDGPGSWRIVHAATPETEATAQSPQQARWQNQDRANADRQTDSFDAVISTLPVTDLVGMLAAKRPDEAAARAAEGLHYLANRLFFLVSDRPPATEAQWLYFPHRDVIFNRGYIPSNFDASLGSRERHILCLEVTCFPGDAIFSRPDEDMAEEVRRDALKLGLATANSLREVRAVCIPYAYPFYDLEYRRRTDLLWEYLGGFAGLLSAGRQGLFLHNNIDHSIYMGLHAADCLLANPDDCAPRWYSRIREFQGFRIVD